MTAQMFLPTTYKDSLCPYDGIHTFSFTSLKKKSEYLDSGVGGFDVEEKNFKFCKHGKGGRCSISSAVLISSGPPDPRRLAGLLGGVLNS